MTTYVKINDGVETHSASLEAGKVYPAKYEFEEDSGGIMITDADGTEYYFGQHEIAMMDLADWEYELMLVEGEHGVTMSEPETVTIPADKFQPGQAVDWMHEDGSPAANRFWDGSTIVERLTSGPFEGEYKVRNSAGDVGIIDGDQLRVHLFGDYSDDDWMDENSADSPDDCECGCDYSPDEAPLFRDYAPVVDEVQDDKVWAALTYLPDDIQPALSFEKSWEALYGVRPPKTRGQADYQIHLIPKVKDPAAPTVEELNGGIDVSAHITDISGFSTTFALGGYSIDGEDAENLVDHPAHYGSEDDPYEVIKVIEAWNLGFHLGNAVKYIPRAGKKDPETEIQDLEKAAWYIQRRIDNLKEANDE